EDGFRFRDGDARHGGCYQREGSHLAGVVRTGPTGSHEAEVRALRCRVAFLSPPATCSSSHSWFISVDTRPLIWCTLNRTLVSPRPYWREVQPLEPADGHERPGERSVRRT